jgi:hypothetical protein
MAGHLSNEFLVARNKACWYVMKGQIDGQLIIYTMNDESAIDKDHQNVVITLV